MEAAKFINKWLLHDKMNPQDALGGFVTQSWSSIPHLDTTISTKLQEFQAQHNIRLNQQLLLQAVTHNSLVNYLQSYQRLEFLGDSVLKFLATVHVYHTYQDAAEGELNNKKTSLIMNDVLSQRTFAMGLDKLLMYLSLYVCLLYSHSNVGLSSDSKVYSDLFESLLGGKLLFAVYSIPQLCLWKTGYMKRNCQTAPTIR